MKREAWNKQILSWALYDWAGAGFSTAVMAVFFPVVFKQHWHAGAEASVSTFHLGLGNSLAGLLIALSAPVLGALADAGRFKKRFLLFFACLGVLATALLALVPQAAWGLALLLFMLAVVGYKGGNVFYDALLPGLCPPSDRDRVSLFGYAAGYLGGGLLFAMTVAAFLWPAFFGLTGFESSAKFTFLAAAAWWALFSVPLFKNVREPRPRAGKKRLGIGIALRQLGQTFREARKYRQVILFLLAFWFYIDGVGTVVAMAVDFGLSLGLGMPALVKALLITQFVAFPATLGYVYLAQFLGTRRAILAGLAVYLGVTVWGFRMSSEAEFYGLAAVVGLVQGGVQALSRSYYSRLIPPGKAAEFFAFYNVFGRFAAVLGPALMGIVALATGSARGSILSLAVFFLVGGLLLTRVETGRN
jgi:MFS transporter, UMF1 family